MDADIVVDLGKDQVSRLVDRLKSDFYVDLEVAEEAVSGRGSFNAIHLASGFKVDFFVMGAGPFDQAELDRSELRQIVENPPRSVYVKTAEDTVLRKLQWFAAGGAVSDRQWRDVLGVIMSVGESIDRDYLRAWADQLGISELLSRALIEAGER
jgi:hypothetical protein